MEINPCFFQDLLAEVNNIETDVGDLDVIGDNTIAKIDSFNGDSSPVRKTLEDTKTRYGALAADLEELAEKQKADSYKANEFDEEIIVIEKWVITIFEVVKSWDDKGIGTEPDEIKKQLREAEVRKHLFYCGLQVTIFQINLEVQEQKKSY